MLRVLELASSPDTCLLGVTLLKVISEEWTNAKSRVKSSRRIKLRHMLAEEVPQVVGVFAHLLTTLWLENVQDVSGAPVGAYLDVNANYASNFINNPDAAEIVKAVLEALQSYLSWAPLNMALLPPHIDILFKYAILNDSMSTLALENLNEMLERNFIPAELSDFLLQLHASSLAMLSKLVKEPTTLAQLDPEYVSKWTQFLNLFVQYHLRRDESLDFEGFLTLFGKYTFYQPSPDGFLDCLDIWEVVLTLLQNHLESGVSIEPFTGVVCDFAVSLMRSLMFRYNADQLEKLTADSTTDETALTDEEESSELDLHIYSALTAISLAYGLYPEVLQPQLMAKVLEPIGDFSNVHTLLSLPQMTDDQVRTVYWIFRDTNTMVRAMALIGSQFVNNFEATFNDSLTLIRTLVDLSTYMKQNELHKYSPEAARLAAELFGAMRAFSEWCAVYWSELQKNLGSNGNPDETCAVFDEIVSAMFNCDGLALNSRSLGTPEEPANIPELVPLSAAVHMRSLASTVKSPRFTSLAVVTQFLNDAHVMASWHTSDVQQSFYMALSFIYLVPWQGMPAASQQWDERAQGFQQFISGLLTPLDEVATLIISREMVPYNQQAKDLIDKSLVVLTGILRESAGKLDKSGYGILWHSCQETVKLTLELLEHYLDDLPMMFRLLQLHIQVFSVLATHIPPELAGHMLQILITNLSSQNRLETLLSDAGGFGAAVAQRLLCLIKALVSRPNAPFLNEAFSFCIERIYPSILENVTTTDVEQSFYEIWCELLLNHYKFLSHNQDTYRVALNCFLRAFQGQDLDIFKLVIGALLEANRKGRIFFSQIFWSEGYASYLATLFHVMIQKTHESLHEDILRLIFQIIEGAGFDPFFDEFVPSFLMDTMFNSILPEQREVLRQKLGRPADPPTLTKAIENLLNDVAFLSGVLRQQQ